jgi:hypothetical protein
MTHDIDWGEDQIDEGQLQEQMARYNAPITKHECDKACGTNIPINWHQMLDIFDDFQLSQRQREALQMEIFRSRNRDNKERLLIRMFQCVGDGTYILRLAMTDLGREVMGDLHFDEREDVEAYYNYAVDIFGFSKSLQIRPEVDEDLFSALDDDEDLFEGLDDESDDLFDFDEDDDPFSELFN